MFGPNVKLRITNSSSPSAAHQPPGLPPSPPSQSSFYPLDGDPISLLEQSPDRVEGRVARVQNTDKVVGAIHRVRHQQVDSGVIPLPVIGEQGPIRLLAHANVEAKDTLTVEIRSVIEIAVILRDDGRETKPTRIGQISVRAVDDG